VLYDFDDLYSMILRAIMKQKREAVACKPENLMLGYDRNEIITQQGEKLISVVMPVALIERPEVLKVQHHEDTFGLLGKYLLQLDHERVSIQQPSQDILGDLAPLDKEIIHKDHE
jgi:hypothetical protein